MTGPDRHNPFQALHTMENGSDFLSANVSWISLGATQERRLEEGLEGSWTWLAILWLVDTDHVTWILAWDWSEVGANQDGHWLLPPVFILDPIFTLCVVTSLLFAHLCFTPNRLFSTWFPNPWLTLLSTAKSSFFCSLAFWAEDIICSSLMHWFGIYKLLFRQQVARIRIIFIEIRVFPTNGLWLHL